MEAIIKIAGVDRSQNIPPESVTLYRALTSQTDTLQFNVVRKGGDAGGGYKPDQLDTIEVIENGIVIFGGQILEIEESVEGADVETIKCSCRDYSYDMDRYLVVGTYEDMSVNDIIASINTTFLPAGYDISMVDCPTIVRYASYNYEQPSKVFQQLAELTNSDWYVDESKKIHFFLKTATSAPFNLTDDNENFYYNTLEIKNNVKSLRNSIVVRGGEYLGNLTSEKQIADGVTTKFLQGYRYSGVFVKVATVSKTVGIDNIDDPALFDALYNFNEKAVIFSAATTPANGATVEVGGLPYIPVIIELKNSASIGKYGEFQFKIIDKSINSKEGARNRARVEITQWAEEISDGTFETKKEGLEVGQTIQVASVIRGINQEYVISRITTRLTNGREFLHSMTLMTTQTYGIIEFLQKLLIEKDKDIIINENEIIQFISDFSDQMTFTDSMSTPVITTGPYLWDTAKWNLATWA